MRPRGRNKIRVTNHLGLPGIAKSTFFNAPGISEV